MSSIPPDPEAIRAAMEPPKKSGFSTATVAKMLGMLAVFALIGSLLTKGNSPDLVRTASRSGEVQYVDTYNHDVAFRFLVPITRDRNGRATELETTMVFGYSVLRDDYTAANRAIRKNWNAAGRATANYLRTQSKLDFVSRLEAINEEVMEILDAKLFPDGLGNVQTVNWNEFRFTHP